jgi:predicted RNA-binding Zn ribbon-like protein
VTVEADLRETGIVRVDRWHAADPTALPLAAAARSAIEILTDAGSVDRLRRCANPACSMLFVNGDTRRQWCTPNICGNRARVARHYRRHRPPA